MVSALFSNGIALFSSSLFEKLSSFVRDESLTISQSHLIHTYVRQSYLIHSYIRQSYSFTLTFPTTDKALHLVNVALVQNVDLQLLETPPTLPVKESPVESHVMQVNQCCPVAIPDFG